MGLTLFTSRCAVLVGRQFLWIAGPGAQATPGGLGPGLWRGVAFGVIYVLPIMLLTLWSAQRLSPATLTFLLTAEILSGTVSGVLLLDDPFGPSKAGGAALIVLAALSEVLPARAQSRT